MNKIISRRIPIITISMLILLLLSCKDKANDMSMNDKKSKEHTDLNAFAQEYTKAWCSQNPSLVAEFFSINGSLSVNDDPPAVGREEITKVAEGFMSAFPDMIVSMDSLVSKSNGIEYHWNLTGTNTGPNGTGNKVQINGFEFWQVDSEGLIKKSKGTFDAEEYNRQLQGNN